jgi:cGMP-dependent protein kinase 1
MSFTEESVKKRSKAELFAHYVRFEVIQEQKEVDAVQERITEHIEIIAKKKTMVDSNVILTCLKNHFIFYNLSENELENIKDKMYYCSIVEGDYVFKEGEIGHCFFVVERGMLELLIDGKLKKEIKNFDGKLAYNLGFGELALLYNTQRTFSVRARESATLWLIDRQTFREAVEEVIIRDYNENRRCLEGIRFFANLTNDQKDIIASALITQKFYKNQIIIQEGDPGSSLYYIKEGMASVFKGTKFIRKLTKGDSFG